MWESYKTEFGKQYATMAEENTRFGIFMNNLAVIDQRESLCSVSKSTHGELTTQVLDWGFTELLPLATLHSTNHGYILDDALQFTIIFERISEGGSGSGHSGRASASTPPTSEVPMHIVNNRHF